MKMYTQRAIYIKKKKTLYNMLIMVINRNTLFNITFKFNLILSIINIFVTITKAWSRIIRTRLPRFVTNFNFQLFIIL